MKKLFITGSLMLLFSILSFCQKDKKGKKLSPEESKDFLSKLNFDSAKFLSGFSSQACNCIDSITLNKKGNKEISEDVSRCIDVQVVAYQLSLKLFTSLDAGNSNKEISLNIDKTSNEYKRYYFEIERWLRDSCTSLGNAVATNNKESDLSISKNAAALEAYNTGIDWMKQDKLEKALSYFEAAVEADPKFAFAWDNIGVCSRKLGKLDAALIAYNKSLEIDPKGVTPLHNIPVVYEFQKNFDKAIEAYQNILHFYPDDPEAYYGEGRIYAFFKIDMEKALQNMCKAYNIYTNTSSPYRVDAEKNINYIHGKMKADDKEARFFEILKENNIVAEKK